MADKNLDNNVEEEEIGIIELTDEETGEDVQFEVIAKCTVDGKDYFALIPVEDDGEEYVILRATIDGDDILFETIDDDDEFEKVEDLFNDMLFNEVDYDEN